MREGWDWVDIGTTAGAAALAAVVGIFVGGITSFTHRQWPVAIVGTRIPLGLIAGMLIVAAVIVGLRLALQSRVVALAGGAGVLAAVAVLASRGPGGSVVVVQDAIGWTWVAAPAVIAAITVLSPGRRGRRRPAP